MKNGNLEVAVFQMTSDVHSKFFILQSWGH